jgi:hypothetical protein
MLTGVSFVTRRPDFAAARGTTARSNGREDCHRSNRRDTVCWTGYPVVLRGLGKGKGKFPAGIYSTNRDDPI